MDTRLALVTSSVEDGIVDSARYEDDLMNVSVLLLPDALDEWTEPLFRVSVEPLDTDLGI